MVDQHKLDTLYMNFAFDVAKLSKAIRKQVGAVLVKDDRIISYGWNGTPPGFDNECEEITIPIWDESLQINKRETRTKKEVIHAEINAIAKVAKSHESCGGADMYCTYSPCYECSKAIIMSGIRSVCYYDLYKEDSLEFLKKANVKYRRV